MLDTLMQVDYDTFIRWVSYWGLFSLASALGIHFAKQLPMSNRVENSMMRKLGSIDKRTGWIIMEIPILLVVGGFYWVGHQPINTSVVMVIAFMAHYFNRAIIFPHRIKVKGKTMPIASMLLSMLFYLINGYIIGYYFGHLQSYPIEWLYDPRFIIGLSLFITGFIINIQSDNILINLRKPGETGYKIPKGGCFRWVSCPNYMGECIEWIGFAIMSWSIPGLVYAAWVVLPLYAQAVGSHQWYRETFGDSYPAARKAIIPFIK